MVDARAHGGVDTACVVEQAANDLLDEVDVGGRQWWCGIVEFCELAFLGAVVDGREEFGREYVVSGDEVKSFEDCDHVAFHR